MQQQAMAVGQPGEVPADKLVIGKYLRHNAGMKLRVGVMDGNRVDYFKGRMAVKALLSPSYAKLKGAPAVKDEAEAMALLHSLIQYQFYLRVERGDHLPPPANPAGAGASSSAPTAKQPRMIRIMPQQAFTSDDYYVFLLPPSQFKTILGAVGMVAVILAGVMFPLWPMKLRQGTWYLSIACLGLIGLFIGVAIIRLLLWCGTKLLGPKPGIWLFPNLFEDVGFVDSFIPLWAYDHPPIKKLSKKKKRPEAAEGESTARKSKKEPVVLQRSQDGRPKIEEIDEDDEDA